MLNGDAFSSNTASHGGGAISVDNGNITVNGSTFTGNQVTSSGFDGGAIRSHRGSGNTAALAITITNSTFSGNTASVGGGGGGGGVWSDADIPVTVTGSTFTANVAEDNGGAIQSGGNLTVAGSTFTGNKADPTGTSGDGGAFTTENANATMTVTNSTISNNVAGDDGGGLDVEGNNSTLSVVASTLAGNTAVNAGSHPGVGGSEGGAISIEGSGVNATITNSTVTRNLSADNGAIDAASSTNISLTLIYDTITSNDPAVNAQALASGEPNPDNKGVQAQAEGPEPANVESDALTSFGTVISNPIGAPNCDTHGAPTTSKGYNFSDDTSCGFANAAAGDVQGPGNDPKLAAALASNGGPTQTLLPQTGSPLIDAIPIGTCSAGAGITTDQRGVTRPQGRGCDIGAVEVIAAIAAIVVQPTFTG